MDYFLKIKKKKKNSLYNYCAKRNQVSCRMHVGFIYIYEMKCYYLEHEMISTWSSAFSLRKLESLLDSQLGAVSLHSPD